MFWKMADRLVSGGILRRGGAFRREIIYRDDSCPRIAAGLSERLLPIKQTVQILKLDCPSQKKDRDWRPFLTVRRKSIRYSFFF